MDSWSICLESFKGAAFLLRPCEDGGDGARRWKQIISEETKSPFKIKKKPSFSLNLGAISHSIIRSWWCSPYIKREPTPNGKSLKIFAFFGLLPPKNLNVVVFNNLTFHGSLTPRYSHDLFHIGPILHQAFPHLRRIIMIDIDLVFRNSTIIIIIKFDHLSMFPSGQMWSNCGMSFKVWVRRPYLPLVSFKFQTFQHSSLNNRRFIWFIWSWLFKTNLL